MVSNPFWSLSQLCKKEKHRERNLKEKFSEISSDFCLLFVCLNRCAIVVGVKKSWKFLIVDC